MGTSFSFELLVFLFCRDFYCYFISFFPLDVRYSENPWTNYIEMYKIIFRYNVLQLPLYAFYKLLKSQFTHFEWKNSVHDTRAEDASRLV